MVGHKVYTGAVVVPTLSMLLTVVTAPTILLYASLYAFFVGIAFHG